MKQLNLSAIRAAITGYLMKYQGCRELGRGDIPSVCCVHPSSEWTDNGYCSSAWSEANDVLIAANEYTKKQ